MIAMRMARFWDMRLATEALSVLTWEPMQVFGGWLLSEKCKLILRLANVVCEDSTNEQLPDDPEAVGKTSHDNHKPDKKKGHTAAETSSDSDEIYENEFPERTLRQINLNPLNDPKMKEMQDPLRKRIKKGARLAIQQMEYIRLMEDRMKDMEKRLQLVENKGVEPGPPLPPPGDMSQPTDFIMGIKRMTSEEYYLADPDPAYRLADDIIQHKRRHRFHGQLPYHLIDVVVGGINQPERLGKDQITKPAAGSFDPTARSLTDKDHGLTIHDLPSVRPERIRINSRLLVQVLEKITKEGWVLSRSGNRYVLDDQVILRPFKLFVTFEQEIRDEIDRLEKIHMRDGSESKPTVSQTATHETQYPSSSRPSRDITQRTSIEASVGAENEEINPLESRRCLEELLVLRELLDKDLKPTFDLHRQIKDGSARNIAFQDLWHLFAIGSEVVSNSAIGQNQTYRILDVAGGRPFLCSRFEAGMEAVDSLSSGRDVPKFQILGYFYDFDGTEFGACSQVHTIKSYDGNKAITSLPCFPVIYSKHVHGLNPRDFFIERGKRFLELTRKTGVVHKRYNGLTQVMDGIREEVNTLYPF